MLHRHCEIAATLKLQRDISAEAAAAAAPIFEVENITARIVSLCEWNNMLYVCMGLSTGDHSVDCICKRIAMQMHSHFRAHYHWCVIRTQSAAQQYYLKPIRRTQTLLKLMPSSSQNTEPTTQR